MSDEKNKIPYVDKESMVQSSHLCFSVATLLQIGLGECASANARTGYTVFSGREAKELVPAFGKVLKYLRTAYDAYVRRAAEFAQEPGNSGADSGASTGN